MLHSDQAAAYFERIDTHRFRATPNVEGAWNPAEQHIAPSLGLLAHALETDLNARRNHPLRIGRLSFDILGTVPLETVEIQLEVLRPGRTIELVGAKLTYQDRVIVTARAWLLQEYDTVSIAGSAFPSIPHPETMEPWPFGKVWDGACVKSVETRRTQIGTGRAVFWLRPNVELIGGEDVSPVARAMAMVDFANGMTPRATPGDVAFPNIDLTVHLFRNPVGEWLGFDTSVSFGPNGIGLTHSIIHDLDGPVGSVSQCLTVRPSAKPHQPGEEAL